MSHAALDHHMSKLVNACMCMCKSVDELNGLKGEKNTKCYSADLLPRKLTSCHSSHLEREKKR